MRLRELIICIAASFLVQYAASAQLQDEPMAGVLMRCSYYEAAKSQSAEIVATGDVAETGGAARSVRLGNEVSQVELKVLPGQVAECVYPDGESVRVKVGHGIARSYGMCGGDPEVFLSLWVNHRKLDSRVWFAGHCIETGALKYSVWGNRVQKCQEAKGETSDEPDTQPSEVCLFFPETERFPLDQIEYPPGKGVPVGSIEIRSGSDAVCHAVKDELGANWSAFFDGYSSLSFGNVEFVRSATVFERQLLGAREVEIDFDNDGASDKVYLKTYESNYMHGSILMVDPSLEPDSRIADAWFLPCQLAAKSIPVRECPPFSQAHDEAGFSMANPGESELHFRARYSHLRPFTFNGATYLSVASESEDTREFVAILRPGPKKSFERKCLLRKVPENF